MRISGLHYGQQAYNQLTKTMHQRYAENLLFSGVVPVSHYTNNGYRMLRNHAHWQHGVLSTAIPMAVRRLDIGSFGLGQKREHFRPLSSIAMTCEFPASTGLANSNLRPSARFLAWVSTGCSRSVQGRRGCDMGS